ncbi:nucleolar protein 6 [Pelomyxa schiedti]|nr:nucleolar protein 6 [Pelomyxa schiedti]
MSARGKAEVSRKRPPKKGPQHKGKPPSSKKYKPETSKTKLIDTVLNTPSVEVDDPGRFFQLEVMAMIKGISVHPSLSDPGIVAPMLMKRLKSIQNSSFLPPSKLQIIGSFSSGTMIKAFSTVDIAVEMPSVYFPPEEFPNYTEIRRKYAEFLATSCSKIPNTRDVKVFAFHNDTGKWSVYLNFYVSDGMHSCSFNLIPCLSSSVLPLTFDHPNSTDFSLVPMIEDMSVIVQTTLFNELMSSYKNAKPVVMMLKVWLSRRRLYGSISGLVINMLVMYVTRREDVGTLTPAHTIFYKVLEIFESGDLAKGISLSQNTSVLSKIEVFKQVAPAVFVDSTGMFNLTRNVPLEVIQELQLYATRSLDLVKSPTAYTFFNLFKVDFEPLTKFDNILIIKGIDMPGKMQEILPTLKEALTDRLSLLLPITQSSTNNKLVFGMIYNDATFDRLVDMGPRDSSNHQVEKFNAFWGSASTLRRFKDSTVCYAAVWDFPQRHLIIPEICKYVLSKHHGIKESDIFCTISLMDSIVPPDNHLEVADALLRLTSAIKRIPKLPLALLSLSPADPIFSQTQVQPVTQHRRGNPITPIRLVFQLEPSDRWPDDIKPLRTLKTAFYLEIAQRLQPYSIAQEGRLLIDYRHFVFSLEMHLPKEHFVMKKQRKECFDFASEHNALKRLAALPIHVECINAIADKFKSYSYATRLSKHWVNSHMFSTHLQEEAVELLVASCYLQPGALGAPHSHVLGFLRFLHLLGSIDTSKLPHSVVVDFQNTLSAHATSRLLFADNSKVAPALAIFATYPKFGQVWTSFWTRTLEPVIFKRIIQFAKVSIPIFHRLLVQEESIVWKNLFVTPLEDYDIVISLYRNKEKFQQSYRVWRKYLVDFNPALSFVKELRSYYHKQAIWFYNEEGTTDVITGVWRPTAFAPQPLDPSCAHGMKPILKGPHKGKVVLNATEIIQNIHIMGAGLIKDLQIRRMPTNT